MYTIHRYVNIYMFMIVMYTVKAKRYLKNLKAALHKHLQVQESITPNS